MRIVLPPSETKTPGGIEGTALSWNDLVLPELTATRKSLAEDLVALAAEPDATTKALGLGAKGDEWVQANRQLLTSPVMAAIERYTGVVFDALDVASLDGNQRAHANRTIWLFSALFGPLRAFDPIPRYRLSFDSKLPGESLKARWQPHARTIWAGDFTLDLRSEGYRALAPLPEGSGVFVRVVKDFGQAVAVGHANKGTKGRLVRDLITSGATLESRDDLLEWATRSGWRFAPVEDAPGEVYLAVS